jgi:hypothetical protein
MDGGLGRGCFSCDTAEDRRLCIYEETFRPEKIIWL